MGAQATASKWPPAGPVSAESGCLWLPGNIKTPYEEQQGECAHSGPSQTQPCRDTYPPCLDFSEFSLHFNSDTSRKLCARFWSFSPANQCLGTEDLAALESGIHEAEWMKDRWDMGSESVKVVVRCRPLNDREKALCSQMVLAMDQHRCQCFIEKPGAADEPPKQFTFDGTYFIDQSTEQMYNEIAYPLVEVISWNHVWLCICCFIVCYFSTNRLL